MSRRYLNELKEPPKHLECPACGKHIPYEEMFQHLLDHFNTKSNSNSPNVNEGIYSMKYNTKSQVLSEAWKITSTDKNGGDYHEHEHNIKDFFDAVARVANKFIPFFTGRKFKVEPHNDVHEATEAPEYYDHIDDIDHERIVKHAEDVIKKIDNILKIYDKLDDKQFKQVRKHKNQLNKIKTMITSELERHKKQALDEGVFNKIRGGVVGGALGAYLGTLPAGLLGGLSDLVVPGSIGPVAAGTWAAATAGGASLGTTFAADSDVYETHKNYTNAVKRSQEPEKKSWFGYVSSKPSQETLDRLYDKHVRAVKAYNAITPFSNDQYPIERKLHEESLLPNILKPSRNTDASGYARYISEQNSSSNLRSKPINEGVIDEAKFIKSTEHDYEPFNDKNAYRITDILKSKKFKHESSRGNSHIYVHVNGSKVLLTKSGSGAITGLTHIDSNGKRTLFARKADGIGQTEIDVKRFQKHLSSLNEGYKYTKVTPEGYEEHKAKILNLLSQYGKAYHHYLGGIAGPDDPEIHRHYEPGFFGRTFGLSKTDPIKHASAFATFKLDHPTDQNQHIEVVYTVGGDDLDGWQQSAKTPHLIAFSHHIKGHPRADSHDAVYYSNYPRHTTANSDGFDEIFPQLKNYLKNNFIRNKPIFNVR